MLARLIKQIKLYTTVRLFLFFIEQTRLGKNF